MERIAFIIGETFVYWSPLIVALGAFAALCAFLALHILMDGKLSVGPFLTVPLALVLSLFFGRLVHWYCRPDTYASFSAAITDFSCGGYALAGVFAGCLLATVMIWLLGGLDSIGRTLDCAAIAGCLGMAVGRLGHFYNALDRGQIVDSIQTLPLVYPVENAVSGESEYRVATFMLQAIVAMVLFVGLLVFYVQGKGSRRLRNGDTCLIFLLCYGASQILLDSTRYDSLFLRSNGFVSLVQILGAVGVVLAVVVFSVRLVRNQGFRWWYLAPWLGIVGLLTLAGVMEYFVQRRGDDAAFYYNFMSSSLAAVVVTALVLRLLAGERQNKKRRAPKSAGQHPTPEQTPAPEQDFLLDLEADL